MTANREYDITIIGGGPGGYVAALHASQRGAAVALVEKDRLGGTCLNRGCIPTKALVRSAEALHEARRAEEFGVRHSPPEVVFERMMARQREVVEGLVSGVERLMRQGGVDVYHAEGSLASPRRVRLSNGEELTSRNVILATGSVPVRPPLPGADLPGVVTSDELLQVDHVPSSLVVIGAGIIGLEFAGIFSALGSRVTVLEMLPRILPPVDAEIARRFGQELRRQRVTVHTGARVTQIRQAEDALAVDFEAQDAGHEAEGEMVLVAVGRAPYTEGLGLAEAGVATDRQAIVVDDRLQTNVDGVYAIGDAIGGVMLAHLASYEGEVAVENALGHPTVADRRAVPSCIFTTPEIASVGLSEEDARDAEIPYRVSRFPFSAAARAQIMGDPAGTVKILCEEGSGRVLGVHILGPHASDLIAEGTLAVRLGATAEDLAATIHAHPTLPEALYEAALGQLGRTIHFQRL